MKHRAILIAAVGSAGLLLTGCSDSYQQLHDARFEPAPELRTLSRTPDQTENAAFYTIDHNMRALNGDMSRLLLLDRPLRLGMEPIR